MLVTEAIAEIRTKINDKDKIEYQDEELLSNLKEAIQFVSTYLISANSPIVVEEMVLEEEDFDLPLNYTKTAGYYPIKITGQKGKLLEEPPITLRYYATYKDLKLEDEMPYNHEGLWQIMIKLASIYALNRNEFNIQQDKGLLDEINQQLAAVVA